MTIAVLLTCYNRREKTLSCLRRLHAQKLPPQHSVTVFLVDDGCSDGTSEAVQAAFPQTVILKGTGSLYWAGGMRLAWKEAEKFRPDYFFLLNDDTQIVPGALEILLGICGSPEARIIAVGAIADPHDGKVIYGAYRNGITGNLPDHDPKDHCHTFNANCILVTARVHREIGILHEVFTHGMADHDYGYSASSVGINIIQSSTTLGYCIPNKVANTWQDSSLPRLKRWNLIMRPNGLPWREWLFYCRRHLGWKWPRYFLSPYLNILLGK